MTSDIQSSNTPPIPEKQTLYLRGAILIIFIFSILVVLTLWIENNDWDRKVASLFYLQDLAASSLPAEANRWFIGDDQPWKWLYRYGTVPGFVLTLLTLAAWYRSFTQPKLSYLRPYLIVFALTSILGAGLIVNAVLKEHTGRPRPRETTEFQGKWNYKPVFKLGIAGQGHSFPCGHCTMGFIFTGGIIFWRRSKVFACASLVAGLGYGVLMSITRIVQGAHFLSDAMWSLGILWMTLSFLYYFIFQPPRTDSRPHKELTPLQKRRLGRGVGLFFLILFLLYLTRRPFYKDHRYSLEIPKEVNQIVVHTNLKWSEVDLYFEDRTTLSSRLEARGFGLPKAKHRLESTFHIDNHTLYLEYKVNKKGYFVELVENTNFRLPQRLQGKITGLPLATTVKN